MTEREYRQDDRDEGYCPVCAKPLTGLTVDARGYCEQHGWQMADWTPVQTGEATDEPRVGIEAPADGTMSPEIGDD
jgi:hypothetical protein